jgi:hypothetical protein
MTNPKPDFLKQEALAAELFDRLESPPIPAALRDEGFLAGIYEHAAAAEAETLGPILDVAMTPVAAPDDACWQDVSEDGEIAHQVARALPDAPSGAPGWLWTRIREDIWQQRAERRRTTTASSWMRRAAAAVLIGAGLFGALRYGPPLSDFYFNGTQSGPAVVSNLNLVYRRDPGLALDDGLLGR